MNGGNIATYKQYRVEFHVNTLEGRWCVVGQIHGLRERPVKFIAGELKEIMPTFRRIVDDHEGIMEGN